MILWLEYRGMRYRIHAGETVLGRGSRVAFFLDEPSVSREHAQIHRTGDTVTLTDLGSSNGTFVNGERVRQSRQLEVGDEVKLGAATMRFGVTYGVSPSSVSPGIELIESQKPVSPRPVMDQSTEPQFGSIEVLESLIDKPEAAESRTELARMVQSSVERLLDTVQRRGVSLGPGERARLVLIARTVSTWFEDGSFDEWAANVRSRLT